MRALLWNLMNTAIVLAMAVAFWGGLVNIATTRREARTMTVAAFLAVALVVVAIWK